MNPRALPGVHGKLPSLGDFITRELPRSFVEPWDGWLQRAIACSRQQLGERWLKVYLESPMWRFVLSAQVCGGAAWAGVVMPSVDRVGRYFPLTLATPLAAGTAPLSVAQQATAWFDRAEELLRAVLEEDACDPETLVARVMKLGPLPELNLPHEEASGAAPLGACRVALPMVNGVAAVMPGLLGQLLARQWGPYSLWWSSGSELIEPSLLICSGLPPAEGYAAMLAGEWRRWSWQEWAVPLWAVSGGGEDRS